MQIPKLHWQAGSLVVKHRKIVQEDAGKHPDSCYEHSPPCNNDDNSDDMTITTIITRAGTLQLYSDIVLDVFSIQGRANGPPNRHIPRFHAACSP